MIKTKGFTIEEMDHFRKFQRRSYAVLTAAAEDIRPGMTEQEVARRLRKAFHEEGVHTYFHVPVALFGSRTAYPGEFGKFEALATERVLSTGETVLLDAAPIYDGYTVDTSFAFHSGAERNLRAIGQQTAGTARPDSKSHTRTTLDAADCWTVDNRIKACGMENCHRKHISAVMGHRVNKTSTAFMRHTQIWG